MIGLGGFIDYGIVGNHGTWALVLALAEGRTGVSALLIFDAVFLGEGRIFTNLFFCFSFGG